jgi:hypothetical protein
MFVRWRTSEILYIGRGTRPKREVAQRELEKLLETEGGKGLLQRALGAELPGITGEMEGDEIVGKLSRGIAAGRYVLIGFRPRPVWAPTMAAGGEGAQESEEEEEKAPVPEQKKWFEIELHDESDPPVPMAGAKYRVELPDGKVIEGELDDTGKARIQVDDPSHCKVSFPDFDHREWENK